MTWKLGLTGSIGMGKSTTAAMLKDLGIPVWDADATVHRLYAENKHLIAAVAQHFPEVIVNEKVNRENIKNLIRKDRAVLTKLEALLSPFLVNDRERFMNAHPDPLIVFDIPLLFETAADQWLDSVLVVSAPKDVQRERVLARAGMTEDQFSVILSRQMPDHIKRQRADYVIETVNMDDTKAAILRLINNIKEQSGA